MDRRSAQVRSQVQRLSRGKPRTGVRYPTTLGGDAVAIARERQAHGVALARIGRDLGLRPSTLGLWLRQAPQRALRPVRLAPDPALAAPVALPARAVLVTPHGLRVEGLDLETLSMLLRALA